MRKFNTAIDLVELAEIHKPSFEAYVEEFGRDDADYGSGSNHAAAVWAQDIYSAAGKLRS